MAYYDPIYYDQELNCRAKAVYIYLKDHANKQGACWPGIKTIAAGVSLSRSTVKRALDDLVKAGLVEADAGVQTSLLDDDAKREKWERIDVAMDHLRQRYGYMSIRRAVTCADPELGRINPRDDHTVHPIGYFGG